MITPLLETLPVSGLMVKSCLTDSVRRSVVGFDASAAFGKLLIVVEHVNHCAQVSVGQARIVDPNCLIGSRGDVVGKVV